MRHRNYKFKFGRQPKHRVAMHQNLATALFTHERITTTVQKAKSLRPFVERLIHKAKANTSQTMIILNRDLKNRDARVNLMQNIAPRFKDLPAGFTRIMRRGRRGIDKAETCMIEIIGNTQAEFEKNERQVELEQLNQMSFWEWETGLLEQEEAYWE